MMISVAVAGAAGRMGREVVRAVAAAEDMALVAAFDVTRTGEDAGTVAGVGPLRAPIQPLTSQALSVASAAVLVDFTTSEAARESMATALQAGVRVVSGTTGLGEDVLDELVEMSRRLGVGLIYAPNFSIGAVLMMHFSEIAARYLPAAEIIELHHDAKRDAPSGTALLTARRIASVWSRSQSSDTSQECAARGDASLGPHIHSIRLPGLVAHQEVLFGGQGQVLTIRHDSLDRTSFMPGVLLAIRHVLSMNGPVIGLDAVLGLRHSP